MLYVYTHVHMYVHVYMCMSVSISSWQDSLEISATLLDEAHHDKCKSLGRTLGACMVGVAASQLVGVRS